VVQLSTLGRNFSRAAVFDWVNMKKLLLLTLFFGISSVICRAEDTNITPKTAIRLQNIVKRADKAATAIATSYSTEASISPGKDKRQCQIVVRISQISEQDGKTTETLITEPRSLTNLGQKASFFVGNDDPKTQCISVDVFCPNSSSDFASCIVTVTRGGQVLSKSATKLKMYQQ
jgi:hypothetical protein